MFGVTNPGRIGLSKESLKRKEKTSRIEAFTEWKFIGKEKSFISNSENGSKS